MVLYLTLAICAGCMAMDYHRIRIIDCKPLSETGDLITALLVANAFVSTIWLLVLLHGSMK